MKQIWYTDGACSGNPGPGGWAAICLDENKIVDVAYEYLEETTNNRCELLALLHVIKAATQNPEISYIVYSDSAYAINSITNWIYGWSRNNWRNTKGKIVENIDIMKEIYSYVQHPIPNLQINKIKGHVGHLGNELADALAAGNKQKYISLIHKNNIEEY